MLLSKNFFERDVEELPLHELQLLRIRTKIGGEFSEVVKDIFSNRGYRLISDFSNNCRNCVGPLSIHKTSVKTSLYEIKLEKYKQFCASYHILPGQKICFRCKNKIFVKNVDSDLLFEAGCSLVNQSLEIFDCSPLKVVRSDRTSMW